MTGPDDAFLAPDDALQDVDEDIEHGTGGVARGREDIERPAPPGPRSEVEAEVPSTDAEPRPE
ncbi:hypothetical protein [Geodermatophilus ruber]|uniref:Uncharacterized protein n=1 Tax=Geodermatophilus ruber TaxID=504800 RepID=A0A1I4KNM4_9ACTN|nr:hypothetical protein [Geodermatophilus ruber]SFL80067.1 hypothetical protein SAMN04488085_11846 [Geodermatophilus ruber]